MSVLELEAAEQRYSDLMNKTRVVLEIFAVFCAVSFLLGVAVGLILNHHHIDTVTDVTASAPQPVGDAVMHVGSGGSGGAGAVEEAKGWYAGRPLFKVPPSSPCREKAGRC